VTQISASCSVGCFWSALELKTGRPTGTIDGINVKSPFEGTGYRFCCADDSLNVPFTSTTNLFPVIGWGNSQMQFTIKYRQVGGATTTTTTTTTTTPAPTDCVDQVNPDNCAYWAGLGDCENDREWMETYCKKTCGVCEGQTDCVDQDDPDNCAYWADNGDCENDREYMETYCQKTCGVCGGSSNCVDQDDPDNCAYWADNGDCENDREYMETYCQKTCGVC